MTYWRMQLHPADPGNATRHTLESLAAGFVGLDFRGDPGDLTRAEKGELPSGQKQYWSFAHEMNVGDRVLVFLHHYPFALVSVDGPYNYIKTKAPELGIWFRHFRRIADLGYYFDEVTNPKDWERLPMTETLTPLRDPDSRSYRLIDNW